MKVLVHPRLQERIWKCLLFRHYRKSIIVDGYKIAGTIILSIYCTQIVFVEECNVLSGRTTKLSILDRCYKEVWTWETHDRTHDFKMNENLIFFNKIPIFINILHLIIHYILNSYRRCLGR